MNIKKNNFIVPIIVSFLIISPVDTLAIKFSILQDNTTSQQVDLQNGRYYLNWANQLIEAGKLDSAEVVLKKARRKTKKSPEIYFTLGYVYYKKGKFRLIPFEKLLELLKVDNYSTAIKNFSRALELKPDYWEARYYLGRTYILQDTKQSLTKAEKEFLMILDYDKNYKDVTFQLANVYLNQQEYDKAIFLFQQILTESPEDGKAIIKLAEIYFDKGMNRQACYFYNLGIDKLKDQELLDTLYEDIYLLMTDEEKSEYENTPLAKKGFIIKKFWKLRSPTPNTVENKRLTEHYHRVKYARENFHISVPPYYDERGKVYIKFGKPDHRYIAPTSEVAFRGNESWSYESICEGLVFDFVEKGGIFHLAQDLREAAGPNEDFIHRYYVATQLYEQRSHISNTYAQLGSHLISSMHGRINTDDMQRYDIFLNDYVVKRNKAIIATPPEVYRIITEKQSLPIVYRMAQFRGNYKKTNLEIYLGVLAQTLSFKKEAENNYYANLEYSTVAIDTLFNDAANMREEAKLETKSSPDKISSNFVLRQVAELNPGKYWINLIVKDQQSNKKALIKKMIDIEDFSDKDLNLSDIQLSFQIEPENENSTAQYIKHNLSILPYPFSSVYRKNPIFVYYEIYNLKYNESGEVEYEIEYKIETLKPKQSFWTKLGNIFGKSKYPIISLSETHRGKETSAIQYIAFDLGKLSYGFTKLTIIVHDKVSDEQKSSAIEFDLIQ